MALAVAGEVERSRFEELDREGEKTVWERPLPAGIFGILTLVVAQDVTPRWTKERVFQAFFVVLLVAFAVSFLALNAIVPRMIFANSPVTPEEADLLQQELGYLNAYLKVQERKGYTVTREATPLPTDGTYSQTVTLTLAPPSGSPIESYTLFYELIPDPTGDAMMRVLRILPRTPETEKLLDTVGIRYTPLARQAPD